jgi:hypothetical protein
MRHVRLKGSAQPKAELGPGTGLCTLYSTSARLLPELVSANPEQAAEMGQVNST